MTMLSRGIWLAIGSLTLCVASSAGAQQDLDKARPPPNFSQPIARFVTKRCTKATGIFGLESFLREHYTASRESAAALAAYLAHLKGQLACRGHAAST